MKLTRRRWKRFPPQDFLVWRRPWPTTTLFWTSITSTGTPGSLLRSSTTTGRANFTTPRTCVDHFLRRNSSFGGWMLIRLKVHLGVWELFCDRLYVFLFVVIVDCCCWLWFIYCDSLGVDFGIYDVFWNNISWHAFINWHRWAAGKIIVFCYHI